MNLARPLYFSPSAVQSTTLMTLLTTSKLSTMCLKAMSWESSALRIPFQSPSSSHSSFMPSSTKSKSRGKSWEQWIIICGKRNTRIAVLPTTMCYYGYAPVIGVNDADKCWPGLRTGLPASFPLLEKCACNMHVFIYKHAC